jgi:hypothetical protein
MSGWQAHLLPGENNEIEIIFSIQLLPYLFIKAA